MITVEHLSKQYGAAMVVDDVSMVIERNSITVIVGTSGSGTQFFVHQGKRYGHILDPRSGLPAEGVLSSTVVAPTAAAADALATAFYVMGVEPALEFCRRRADIAAVIVRRGVGTAIEVASHGLADDELRLITDEEV